MLLIRGSQKVVDGSLGSLTFSGGLEGQNNFHNNAKTLFAFFYLVGMCNNDAKALPNGG